MQKIYQTEWQGIRFADFAKLSSTHLAGPEFYARFYEEFFKRNQDLGQVSPAWREGKEQWAKFILARSRAGSKVLAVGCGLGAVEHCIHSREPKVDLFIHEVAPASWGWIGPEFADDHKFTGRIPACLPEGIRFDLVYLATVDYALDDDGLVGLLAAVRRFLSDAGGQCLLISASFEEAAPNAQENAISPAQRLKALGAAVLDRIGLRPRGQFWGWIRTRAEYQSLMQRAGYRDIEEGFIDPDKRADYWIAGR